jgi:hypothetical protein
LRNLGSKGSIFSHCPSVSIGAPRGIRFLLPLYRSLPTQTPSTYLDPESGYETASRDLATIQNSFWRSERLCLQTAGVSRALSVFLNL